VCVVVCWFVYYVIFASVSVGRAHGVLAIWKSWSHLVSFTIISP
jgi:hypothetical protein